MRRNISILGMPRAVFIALLALLPLYFTVLIILTLLGIGKDRSEFLAFLSLVVIPVTAGYKWQSLEWTDNGRWWLKIYWPIALVIQCLFQVFVYKSGVVPAIEKLAGMTAMSYGGFLIGWLLQRFVAGRCQ